MNKLPRKQLQAYKRMTAKIINYYFGSKPVKMDYKAAGLTNMVFDVSLPRKSLIVRIAKSRSKLNDFYKEQWAVGCVKKSGVPVANVLKVGDDIIGKPYMIQEKIRGIEGPMYAEPMKIIEQMGRLAAKINSIPTRGYGYGIRLNWMNNPGGQSTSWKSFLLDELKVEQKLSVLQSNNILTRVNLRKIKTTLKHVLKWKNKPSLNHGDIRMKNVIVNDKGKIIALLDWENCSSNIAPYWDLSIALHDLNVDEKEAFVKGYGLTAAAYSKMHGVIKMFNALNYADVIEKLAKKKNQAEFEQYRLRLNGYYELFSF